VSTEWQQKALIRTLESTNKQKEVKKGTAARISPVALDSNGDPDAAAQKESCGFVLYTELVDIQPGTGTTLSGAVGTGVTLGKIDEPPDMRREIYDATVNYRIMRDGDPHSWTSGIVTEKDAISEDALVSRLMNQIANRAANDLRNRQPSMSE
jgi:hypothetical protein